MSAGFDGQFVIVTLAAAWGAWILLRPLWASRKSGKPTGACGNCSSAACKPVERAEAAAFSSSGSGSGLVAIGSGSPRRAKGAAGPPPGGGV